VQISAIGADAASDSAYARTKADGEAAVLAAFPGAVILRPSIIFGPEDQFFNRFAAMARLSPVLPLVGADTRFQPVMSRMWRRRRSGRHRGGCGPGGLRTGRARGATFPR
jgi:uncharacterized protein YbjT (DUF2867 family)